jgi:predicted dehydrogenase
MAAGFIRLDRGAVVNFRISWAANITRETFTTMVLGTEGGLTTDPLVLATNLGSYQVDVTPRLPADRNVHFSGHWALVEQFMRVFRGEEEPLVRREEVLNVMKVLDAIYRSAEEGKEIALI